MLGQRWRADRNAIHYFCNFRLHALAGDERACAVARHGKDFRETIELHEHIGPACVCKQGVWRRWVVAKVLVGLVNDEPETKFGCKFEESGEKIGRVGRATWVVGRTEHNGAGAVIDQCLGRGRLGKRLVAKGRNEPQLHPRHLQPHLMIEVVGRWHNDIVAALRQRHEGCTEGLIAAGRDRYLAGQDDRLDSHRTYGERAPLAVRGCRECRNRAMFLENAPAAPISSSSSGGGG